MKPDRDGQRRLASSFASVLFSVVAALAATDASAVTYTFTDLGSLGGRDSIPFLGGVNNVGQVVGYSTDTSNMAIPVLWSSSLPTELGGLGGSNGGYARSINDSGVVVGDSWVSGNFNYRAVQWSGTSPTELAGLGGGLISGAHSINATGQIAGYSGVGPPILSNGQVVGYSTYQAVRWSGGVPTALASLGGSQSFGFGINNAGQVVGESQIAGNAVFHAALWNGTTPTDLGLAPGWVESQAFNINNAGQAVGHFIDSAGGYHAIRWDGTVPTELTGLDSEFLNEAYDINDAGQVVGWSGTQRTAVVWNGTTPIDLNSFLDASLISAGIYLQEARGINDKGQISGYWIDAQRLETRGFLLTPTAPVPEQEAYSLALAGLGVLGFFAASRRKGESV